MRVLAPVLSFTTDEVWEHYPKGMRAARGDALTSVQLAGWPARADFAPALPADVQGEINAFAPALAAREAVTKALEDARAAKLVNKSQEAAVTLTAPAEELAALKAFGPEALGELFIVSGVDFAQGDELSAAVRPADGEKCPRCWNYRELGGNPRHADVCERCGDVLDAIGFPGAEA